MLFSVVIPTCDRGDLLARCLEALTPGAQSLPTSDYEVIVTDDGARDSAEAMMQARFPWARWTAGPRRGPAANRNHGASLATGEWIAFTDDDCVPDRGWLAAFAACQRGNESVVVWEGRTYVDRPRRHLLEFSPVNPVGGHLWSCNFAIRRTVFGPIGGFDERFPYNAMEDVELALRLKQRGCGVRFEPAAAVRHPWRTIADWRQHDRRHRASRLLLESIHPGAGFPISWPRAMRTHARVVFSEHLAWLVRRPLATAPVLPLLWKSMAWDIWAAWKYHRRGARAG